MATTVDGALSVAIGKGGVTSESVSDSAIDLTSANGDIFVNARGAVAGRGCGASKDLINFVGGVHATSNGVGNIAITGSASFFAQYGRGIWAQQSATGLGAITISGSGATREGTTSLGCCSAIRAEIDNPLDSGDIVVDRSGDIRAQSTLTPPEREVSAGIHILSAGTGDILVQGGTGAKISNAGLFGIDVEAYGPASSGDINVSTGALSTTKSIGTGIFVANSALAIPLSAGSSIAVTNNGTIKSGAIQNPVGVALTEGGGVTATPAGILAGYDGGPVFGPAAGPYTSCATFGCTTLMPNQNVNGTVSVVNNGVVKAAGGDGIFAFNFGDGDVSVASTASITAMGLTGQNGIEAFTAGTGDISITAAANVTAKRGNGIETTAAGTGKTTIDLFGANIEGATAGVVATSTSGRIQINNAAEIQNTSGSPGDRAIATLGVGNATLTNKADGVVTGTVSMTGDGINKFGNLGIWNTQGASKFGGSGALDAGGAVNVLGPTVLGGLTAYWNSGSLNLAAGSALAIGSGNYTQTTKGALSIAIGASGPAQVVVKKEAALSGVLTLVDVAAPKAVYLPSTRYTILTANGGVAGNFGTLRSTADLTFLSPALSYDANHVYLSFVQTRAFASVALTPNGAASAAAAQVLGVGAPLYDALVTQSSAGAPQAFDALSGEIHASAVSAAFDDSRLPREAVLDRLASPLDALPSGGANGFAATNAVASNLPSNVLAAWGQALGSSGRIGGDGNAATLDRSLGGFILGLDAALDSRYRIGVAGGYTQSTLSLDAQASSGRLDSTFAGLYGGASFNALQLRGGALYAHDHYGTERLIAFPGFSNTATSGYAGNTVQAFGEAGWRIGSAGLAGPTFLEPFVGALAMHIDTAGFTESGGAAALAASSQGYGYGATTLGLRAEASLVADMPMTARGMLAWRHAFGDVTPRSALAFASAPSLPFAIAGAPIARDALALEAGFDWRLTPTATLGIFYSAALAARNQDNAVTGRVEVAF